LAASPDCSSACLGLDIHIHDTYFVVAHFHYIMVGGAVMGYVGGIHFWWRRLPAGFTPKTLSRIAAVTLFVGFNLTFFPQFILGYLACRAAITPIRRNSKCSMCCPPPALQYSRWVIFCR